MLEKTLLLLSIITLVMCCYGMLLEVDENKPCLLLITLIFYSVVGVCLRCIYVSPFFVRDSTRA